MDEWNRPRIGDLLRNGPKSWRELEAYFPKSSLSRNLDPLLRERIVFQLDDRRYALVETVDMEERVFIQLQKLCFPVKDSDRSWLNLKKRVMTEDQMAELVVKTALAQVGEDSSALQSREAGFRAYRRLIAEVKKWGGEDVELAWVLTGTWGHPWFNYMTKKN